MTKRTQDMAEELSSTVDQLTTMSAGLSLHRTESMIIDQMLALEPAPGDTEVRRSSRTSLVKGEANGLLPDGSRSSNHKTPVIQPTPPWEFNGLNHQPFRNPLPPEPIAGLKGAALARYRSDRAIVAAGIAKQRQMPGVPWNYEYLVESTFPEEEDIPDGINRDVAFFPYAHLAGLSYMTGVVAICCGGTILLYRLSDTDDDSDEDETEGDDIPVHFERLSYVSSRLTERLLQPGLFDKSGSRKESPRKEATRSARNEPTFDPPPQCEDYFSLAWSINISRFPFVPILAAAGQMGVIDIYTCEEDLKLKLDRTLTNHGKRINHVTFSLNQPHLLASASDDLTVALWNPTVSWGSNQSVTRLIPRNEQRKSQPRPFVPGELLAKFTIGHHTEGVLCCDFHPTLPLLVSSGMDGFIKIFSFPQELGGPTWPTSRPVPCDQSKLDVVPEVFNRSIELGPPIFSSSRIHPGAWVDTVLWCDADTTTIMSKAAGAMVNESRPRLLVRIWQPSALDLDQTTFLPASLGSPLPSQAVSSVSSASDSTSFIMLQQIELQGKAYIGDRIGFYRDSRRFVTKDDQQERTGFESMIAIASDEPAVYIFTPGSDRQYKTTSTAVPNYFPAGSTFDYDFYSRLLPAYISDLIPADDEREAEASESEEEENDDDVVHFRSIAFSPQDGKFIIGVGDEGVLTVWKRSELE